MKSAINQGQILPWIEHFDLGQIEADGWYPLHAVLEMLWTIANDWNGAVNLMSIGMMVARKFPHPLGYEEMSFVEQMGRIDTLYQSAHRKGDVGDIETEPCCQRCLCIKATIPYPDDILYGMLWQKARQHFQQFDLNFISRRDEGADATILQVRWHDMTAVTGCNE